MCFEVFSDEVLWNLKILNGLEQKKWEKRRGGRQNEYRKDGGGVGEAEITCGGVELCSLVNPKANVAYWSFKFHTYVLPIWRNLPN